MLLETLVKLTLSRLAAQEGATPLLLFHFEECLWAGGRDGFCLYDGELTSAWVVLLCELSAMAIDMGPQSEGTASSRAAG